MIEDTLKLKDGRLLGFGIYGNPGRIPVIDFHGIPGSRREAAMISSYTNLQDVCFIGFDRPGFGRSTPKSNFRIPDLPNDVLELINHLEIKRFVGLGYSGGGPFALACAAMIPERISTLGIVSGVGPAEIGSAGMHEKNKKKFNLARTFPFIARLMLTLGFSNLQRHPENLERQMSAIWKQMPEVDRVILEDKIYVNGILEITKDAISQSVAGWVNEEILMTLPWQISLENIKHKSIFLWHGGLDKNVPLSMGKAVAQLLPECQSTFCNDEGHLSLFYHHGEKIIRQLVEHHF